MPHLSSCVHVCHSVCHPCSVSGLLGGGYMLRRTSMLAPCCLEFVLRQAALLSAFRVNTPCRSLHCIILSFAGLYLSVAVYLCTSLPTGAVFAITVDSAVP
jgi:hypothetical protein